MARTIGSDPVNEGSTPSDAAKTRWNVKKKLKKTASLRHPVQPIGIAPDNIERFKRNAIVNYLLGYASRHGCDLNEIAVMEFSAEDRQQFAQLIGYSVYGYSELPYVDDKAWRRATKDT